ncbi:type II secretion system inner membrane protein GspF [Halobacteriovorax sp. JY17]|uniref:type II secretion system inner membrane protein GspF n=1 Tax=Halobacteriovorax sp. JY17 TaxID=2014617 RepID=UPI000C50B002|nr:type II secretion system inner membrane protein GspF [Halobacteriovorax sp. JY17]PIK15302.1 MAG: type II secretion system protein GspF [Halobacteriovorax sp. JY17]
MAIYSYKGLDKTGKEIKKTIDSDSLNSAKAKVRSMGIMLIEISEQKAQNKSSGGSSFNFGPTVSIQELSLMTRQLATLIKAKIQIVEAFNALVDQTDNQKFKSILAEIKQKINEGSSLANALADYPKVFDNVYVNMVDAGETSGTLQVVLLRLADFTEAQVKLKNKIKGAMTYPLIMAFVGAGMMGIIFIFVIPKITRIFETMKKDLPLQTEICIWISQFLKSYWWAVIIGTIFAYTSFKKYIATKNGKSKWDSLLLKLPIVGELVTMINVSRFCSTLATLLNSGVPIIASLKIVKNLIANVHMQGAVEEAKISVSEGASLAGPLARSGLFPTMVTHMMTLGEKSGELEDMLKIISENYEDQVESKLNGLTSVLEPIMLVGMGIAVAFIIFSVVVPMMQLNSLH